MRRVIVTVICVLFLSGCGYSKADLDAAWDSGYMAGYSDAESEIGYDYGSWDDDSFSNYGDDFDYILEEAINFAETGSEWSFYEAWNNLGLYLDNDPEYKYFLSTDAEFRDCINVLVRFAMFMDEY